MFYGIVFTLVAAYFLWRVARYFNRTFRPHANSLGLFPTPETLVKNAPTVWDKKVVDLLAHRVVKITLGNVTGSGFILDEQHILTAEHVIDKGDLKLIRLDGPWHALSEARVTKLGRNTKHDLALLFLAEPLSGDWPEIPVAFSQTAPLEVFGFSLRQWDWMRNHVEPLNGTAQQQFGSSDAHWIPGDSGSALLTAKGELAAVVVLIGRNDQAPYVGLRTTNQGPNIRTIRGFLKSCGWNEPLATKTKSVVQRLSA